MPDRAFTAGGGPATVLLTDLTGGLDPSAAPIAGWLRTVRGHDPILHDRVSAWMRTTSAALHRSGVTVAFGGHFSSGKSTVLNMLLGRDLLPTGKYPETGVACWIRRSARDELIAVTGTGRENRTLSPAAIADEVSLLDHGDYRSRPRQVRRLLVGLAGDSVPPGVTWIDSPGINDTDAMTARAAEAAAGADVLIWVVNSKQPLSLKEQAFLAARAGDRGPAHVVFLVNQYLAEDTPGEWALDEAEEFEGVRRRIHQAVGGWHAGEPPEIVFVSGRAAATDPSRYGGPAARALLASFADPGHERVVASRVERAGNSLTEPVALLAGAVVEEAAAVQARKDERAAVRQRLAAFRADIEIEAPSVFARHRPDAESCIQEVRRQITPQTLQRNNTYGDALSHRLRGVAGRLTDALVDLAETVARRHGLAVAMSGYVREPVAGLLDPGRIVVPVPAGTSAVSDVVTPMAVEVSNFNIRRRIFAAAAAIDSAVSRATSTQDAATAGANTAAAGAAAVTRLFGSQNAAVALIVQGAEKGRTLPAKRDKTTLLALSALHDHLSELQELARAGRTTRQ